MTKISVTDTQVKLLEPIVQTLIKQTKNLTLTKVDLRHRINQHFNSLPFQVSNLEKKYVMSVVEKSVKTTAKVKNADPRKDSDE